MSNLQTVPPPTEDQFRSAFLTVATAANWNRTFHLVDRGLTRAHNRIAQELADLGHEEAARHLLNSPHARTTAYGFPDLVTHHPEHGILIAELKSDRKQSKPTPDQWEWLIAFRASLTPPDNPYAKSRVHLWRPAHWPAIHTQLGLYETPVHCLCPVCQDQTPALAPPRRPRHSRSRR